MTTSSLRSFRRRSASRRSRSELLRFLLFPLDDAERRDELVRDGGAVRDLDADDAAAKAETRHAGAGVVAKRDIATTNVARAKRRRRMPPTDFLWLLQPAQLYVETETPAVADAAGWLTTKSVDSGFILAKNSSVYDSEGFSVCDKICTNNNTRSKNYE